MNGDLGPGGDRGRADRCLAGLAEAAVLLVAVADPAAAAVVSERARRVAPRLDLVVRTQTGRLATNLVGEPRVWPTVGRRELAAQMARVTLARYGLSGPEIEAIAQGLRLDPTDGPDAPPPGAPSGSAAGLRRRIAALAGWSRAGAADFAGVRNSTIAGAHRSAADAFGSEADWNGRGAHSSAGSRSARRHR